MRAKNSTTSYTGMDITPANARRTVRGERQQKEIRKEAKGKAWAKEVLRIILLTKVMGKERKRGAKERVSTKAKELRRKVAGHAKAPIAIVIAPKEEEEEEEKRAAKEA